MFSPWQMQSGYSQPGYQQPGYQQPAYQHPGYQQPAYQHPGYPQPAYQHPGYAGLANQHPANVRPIYPAYAPPVYPQQPVRPRMRLPLTQFPAGAFPVPESMRPEEFPPAVKASLMRLIEGPPKPSVTLPVMNQAQASMIGPDLPTQSDV